MMMHSDIAGRDHSPVANIIQVGDARLTDSWTRLTKAAAGCASSPPYLNNFDYADATRLEMYFLGEADSWASLCSVARSGMIVATTQQTSVARAANSWERLLKFPAVHERASQLGVLLLCERRSRPRGKEYDRLLPSYLIGIAEVLTQLAANLASGSTCAWLVGDSAPYGVYIDTPSLLTMLAEECGFTPQADITLRKRGLRWSLNGTRHQTPLAERLLIWQR
jgi:hypothetical protein